MALPDPKKVLNQAAAALPDSAEKYAAYLHLGSTHDASRLRGRVESRMKAGAAMLAEMDQLDEVYDE